MPAQVSQGTPRFPLLGKDSALHSESNRLASFEKWPEGHHVSTLSLAAIGFHYTGHEDEVKCHFCGFTKREWGRWEKPEEVHRRASPACPRYNPLQGPTNISIPAITLRNAGVQFVATPQQPEDEAPVEASEDEAPVEASEDEAPVEASEDEARPVDLHKQRVHREMRVQLRPGRREHVADHQYPAYAVAKIRIASFNSSCCPFPRIVALKMCHAGFFYAGNGDLVICHDCGLNLHEWKEPYDPAIEHARHLPSCRHLVKVTKGTDAY